MPYHYFNTVPVAAHRGNAKYFPENTVAAFRSALSLSPDMLETDLHMTSDGEIVIMHDHLVDRTTNGSGLVREKTYEQIRKLDAGSWKGEQFIGEKVPSFAELLELTANVPNLLFNIELKDYPADSGDFAYRSADKAIAMMKAAGIFERSVVNTWSGELNEYLVRTYDGIRIHAYYPQERMGPRQTRYVFDYAFCVCLFGTHEAPVVDKKVFDLCKAYGAEPWVYFKEDTPELYDAALANGARLFTSNDPAWAMEYLRTKGLHQ